MFRDLDLLFKSEHKICEMVRASVKMHRRTFMDLDKKFAKQVIALRDLHLMTLTYFFKVKI